MAFQFLPMLLLGAWAGVIADTYDKRKMSILTQSGLAAQALLLGLLDLAGLVTFRSSTCCRWCSASVTAFDNPARRGLVTELVPTEDIPNATSLNTAVMTGSRIFGPALAAVLVATDRHGLVLHRQRDHVLRDHLLARRDPHGRDVHDAAAPQGRQADP